jgi:transcriptional regulator with XRE-family HTH domain
MANERLRAALVKAGLELEDLAARVDVDSKTVQRWLGGRTPHARHRAKVTHVLDCDEQALWPELAQASRPPDDSRELAGIFAAANDLRAPDWRPLLREAREHIDLLDYTLTDIITAPQVAELLAAKAAAGCQVRILIAHPKSIWVTSLAQQLGQDTADADGNTRLDREISTSRSHLEPLIGNAGIELRTFWAERTNTILRFDNQMLVSLHLYATPGPQAPLIHLRRSGDQGLFDRFADHLDAIFQDASEPIEPNPELFPPPVEMAASSEPSPGAAQAR